MNYYVGGIPFSDELYHHGILGMHWGIRRYQNSDGTLTAEGKERYNRQMKKEAEKDARRYADAKMFYGQGAGNRRKLLNKELEKKFKDPVYKKHFDAAIKDMDYTSSIRKAKAERRAIDMKESARKNANRILTAFGYGSVSIGTAALLYMNNKDAIDDAIAKILTGKL